MQFVINIMLFNLLSVGFDLVVDRSSTIETVGYDVRIKALIVNHEPQAKWSERMKEADDSIEFYDQNTSRTDMKNMANGLLWEELQWHRKVSLLSRFSVMFLFNL